MKSGDELARLWLLVQSGEAGAAERERLTELMASEPGADRRVASWTWVCEQAGASCGADVGPSAATVAAVMAAAQSRTVPRRGGRLLHFPAPPVVRWIAQVAAVLVVLGGGLWMVHSNHTEVTTPRAVTDVEAILLMASGEMDDLSAGRAGSESLDALADQLLEFQGFSQDSSFEEELVKFLQDEPSTVPQAHRIHGSLAERCG
jgi:hypothetical protein